MKKLPFINTIRTTLISIVLFMSLSLNANAQRVLVAGASHDSWLVDVQSKLVGTGLFTGVDFINIGNTTPTLVYLQQYVAVLVFTDYAALNPDQLGDILAQYIDGGGGVVDAVFENASVDIVGDYGTNTYRCLLPLSQREDFRVTLGNVLIPAHPVMRGVTSFDGGLSSYRSTSTTLTPTSYRIANYNNGEILVAARQDAGLAGNKRRVSLNFYPPSIDARNDFWVSSTDGDLLMANSLLWTAGIGDAVPIPTWVIGLVFGLLILIPVFKRFRLFF